MIGRIIAILGLALALRRRRRGLSRPSGQADRPDRAGRRQRHRRAADPAGADRRVETADRDREQDRRQQHHRHQFRGEVAAGRLHAGRRAGLAFGQSGGAGRNAVRYREGPRAHHPDRQERDGVPGQSEGAGKKHARVCRARQSQPGQVLVRDAGPRQPGAPRHRAVGDDGRRRRRRKFPTAAAGRRCWRRSAARPSSP